MLTALAVVALGFIAVVLFTPLDLSLRCERGERRRVIRYRFGVRWLFGLVRTDIVPSRSQTTAPKTRTRAKTRKPRRKRRPKHVGAMLMTRGFVEGALRLIRRLFVALRLRIPFVWLRAGLDDPADTGLLTAWMLPLSTYLTARSAGRVDMASDFTGETFQFVVQGEAHVVPARLVWPLLAFGLSPSTLRGLVALRTGRSG